METERATLRIVEVARILGVCRATAYELARRGRIPGVLRLGRRLVVSKKALDDFLADGPFNESQDHGAGLEVKK